MKWLVKSYHYEKDQIDVYDLYLSLDGEPINALEGRFALEGVQVQEVYYGQSMVRYWIEAPRVENGAVLFSGIRPFGFEGGQEFFLFRVIGRQEEGAVPDLRVKDFQVLEHDGRGTLLFQGKNNEVVMQKAQRVQGALTKDTEAPYPFYPKVEKNAEGRLFISFYAQDDLSGVEFYEFVFREGEPLRFDEAGVYWIESERGVPLEVMTQDQAGNQRVEMVVVSSSEPRPFVQEKVFWYEIPLVWICMALLFLSLIFFKIRLSYKKGS